MNPLDYRDPRLDQNAWTPPPWVVNALSAGSLLMAVVMLLLLQSLIAQPYRPPDDMSSLLDNESIALARTFQVICLAVAFVAAFHLCVALVRWRSEPRA